MAHARPTLDSDRLAELGAYNVLTFADPSGGGIDRGKAIGVIDATPEDEVFRVVTDFTKYQEYMPRVSGVEQITRNDDSAQVMLTAVELPFPAGRTWIEVDSSLRAPHGRDLSHPLLDMKRGNMKQYLGSLYIEPWSATKTAITYELVAEPNVTAPKSFVNKGVRRSVGKFVHALRQHINEACTARTCCTGCRMTRRRCRRRSSAQTRRR